MHCVKISLDRSASPEEHPCHSLLPVRIDDQGIDVRILTCSMMDEGTGYSFIHIIDRSEDASASIPEGEHVYPHGSSSITRVSRTGYMAMVVNRSCRLSALISARGCFLFSAIPVTDTLIEWTLVGPDSPTLHLLLADIRAAGFSFELISSASMSEITSLTPKQQEYFDAAMDLGYYDVPKRIGLDELSKVLGVSKSTLNVSLRTAEKRIFESYRLMHLGYRARRRSEHVRGLR